MPKLDGTGPLGRGAGTGRRMGNCVWGAMPRQGCCGGCFRCGGGCGRFISPKNELSALEEEEKMLLEQLEIVKTEKEALKSQK